MRSALLFPLIVVSLALLACHRDHKPAQSPTPEYSDQQEYANTPTTGPASESSSGYYGVGNNEAPQHQPASPSKGGHEPY